MMMMMMMFLIKIIMMTWITKNDAFSNENRLRPQVTCYLPDVNRVCLCVCIFSRYVEEHVQRTGVAIETQGFTVVTSGRKRESLTGNATMHLYPYLEPLRQIEGKCVIHSFYVCHTFILRMSYIHFTCVIHLFYALLDFMRYGPAQEDEAHNGGNPR
ncbi:hypothetical protein ElyMa_001124400 [Elysia marginata]|uniref:Secreted protein n=1 Tax=Elysia marginata TaxID=1093978 RepID=A0AAV4HX01_9GAST|nr:hypothetical protein ElyMa_001124400 [Elysia marginata]